MSRAATRPPLGGIGLYFVDIFACTLFCLSLALVGARFSREMAVPIELPRAAGRGASMGEVEPVAVTLRGEDGRTRIYWEAEPVSLSEVRARLEADPPAALVFRMEASEFTRAMALAHAVGVRDIRIAYEADGTPPGEGGARGVR